VVERFASGDLGAVTGLAREVSVPGWSRESLASSLADPATLCLVAHEASRALVGFALGRSVVDELEVLLVAVAPRARRRGVGRALVEALLAHANAATAHLEVRASNAAAIALYERAGFVAAGRRPRYYEGREDAVTMRRERIAARAGEAIASG
jgi:ribosomal-protein-alanine N-acetyltransferase